MRFHLKSSFWFYLILGVALFGAMFFVENDALAVTLCDCGSTGCEVTNAGISECYEVETSPGSGIFNHLYSTPYQAGSCDLDCNVSDQSCPGSPGGVQTDYGFSGSYWTADFAGSCDDDGNYNTPPTTCGNGVCQPEEGEDCLSCSSDCGVCPVDFSISVSPSYRSVDMGNVAIYDVVVTSLNNFTGDVDVNTYYPNRWTFGCPGSWCEFSGSAVNSAVRVNLTPGSSVSLALLVHTDTPQTPIGPATFYVQAYSPQRGGIYQSDSAIIDAKMVCTYGLIAPSNITCDPTPAATSYNLTWTPSNPNTLPTIIRNLVRVSSTQDGAVLGTCAPSTNCTDIGISASNFTATGLAPSSTYWNRVAVQCQDAGGGLVRTLSAPAVQCTTAAAPPPIIPPGSSCETLIITPLSGLACSGTTSTGYNLSWNPAGPAGTFDMMGVRVALQSSPSGALDGSCVTTDPTHCKNGPPNPPLNATSFAVTGLQPNTWYFNRVVVQCTNIDGSKPYKEVTLDCRTDPTPDCVPNPNTSTFTYNGTPEPVSQIFISSPTANLTVGWGAVSGVSNYTAKLYNASGGELQTVNTGLLSATFGPLTPAAGGTLYNVRVTSNIAGACPTSSMEPITLIPPATSCFSPTPNVVLTKSTLIDLGDTADAYAPTGYNCGNFYSTDGGVAPINGATGHIDGGSVGSSNIGVAGNTCIYYGLSCPVNSATIIRTNPIVGGTNYSFDITPKTSGVPTLNITGDVGGSACGDITIWNTTTGSTNPLNIVDVEPAYNSSLRSADMDGSHSFYEDSPPYSGPGEICFDTTGLPAGSYTDHLTYRMLFADNTETNAPQQTVNINVTLNSPIYNFTVTPSLSFSATQGFLPSPSSKNITVTNNSGPGISLIFTRTQSLGSPAWANVLQPPAAFFSLGPGGSAQVPVLITSSSLTADSSPYTGTVTFDEPNAGRKVVNITYHVAPVTPPPTPPSPLPPTVTLDADPASGDTPVTSDLTWTTTNMGGATCSATGGVGWPGSKLTTGPGEGGTQSVSSAVTTTYNIHCENAAGFDDASAIVTVDTAPGTVPVRINPGTGGKVKSTPEGIKCGLGDNDCLFDFDEGDDVCLTAIPSPQYVFTEWQDDCSSDPDPVCCFNSINSSKEATPVFELKDFDYREF